MFKVPEAYRCNDLEMRIAKDHGDSTNGVCVRKTIRDRDDVEYLLCLASNGLGWEHVSVSVKKDRACTREALRCPTWGEMCLVKSMFWGPEDIVMQLHPAQSMYVNYHEFYLHLWRPGMVAVRAGVKLPVPAPMLVGPVENPLKTWRPLPWWKRLWNCRRRVVLRVLLNEGEE